MTTPLRSKLMLKPQQVRHYGGFVLAGTTALIIDVAALSALAAFGVPVLLGRLLSIAAAMVAAWWINRTITFSVDAPPSLREFAKFAAVSMLSVSVNYLVFAAILFIAPETMPALAVVLACGVSTFTSYFGFRFGVFGAPDGGPSQPEDAAPATRPANP